MNPRGKRRSLVGHAGHVSGTNVLDSGTRARPSELGDPSCGSHVLGCGTGVRSSGTAVASGERAVLLVDLLLGEGASRSRVRNEFPGIGRDRRQSDIIMKLRRDERRRDGRSNCGRGIVVTACEPRSRSVGVKIANAVKPQRRALS